MEQQFLHVRGWCLKEDRLVALWYTDAWASPYTCPFCGEVDNSGYHVIDPPEPFLQRLESTRAI